MSAHFADATYGVLYLLLRSVWPGDTTFGLAAASCELQTETQP